MRVTRVSFVCLHGRGPRRCTLCHTASTAHLKNCESSFVSSGQSGCIQSSMPTKRIGCASSGFLATSSTAQVPSAPSCAYLRKKLPQRRMGNAHPHLGPSGSAPPLLPPLRPWREPKRGAHIHHQPPWRSSAHYLTSLEKRECLPPRGSRTAWNRNVLIKVNWNRFVYRNVTTFVMFTATRSIRRGSALGQAMFTTLSHGFVTCPAAAPCHDQSAREPPDHFDPSSHQTYRNCVDST